MVSYALLQRTSSATFAVRVNTLIVFKNDHKAIFRAMRVVAFIDAVWVPVLVSFGQLGQFTEVIHHPTLIIADSWPKQGRDRSQDSDKIGPATVTRHEHATITEEISLQCISCFVFGKISSMAALGWASLGGWGGGEQQF